MLENLEPYSFTHMNLNKYYSLLDNTINNNDEIKKLHKRENQEKKNQENKNQEKKNQEKKNQEKKFVIAEKDKFFWAFYIFLHSYEEYHLINNFFITEKNFKINCVTKIREEKNKLKIHKISKNVIENDLVNENKITLKTLNCLALLYNLNIIYIKKRTIFIMNYSNDKLINCKNIIEENNNEINIITLSDILIQELLDTYYNIENINKPLNAISYYKLNDLIKISKKLNLDYTNKLKKNLYTEISNYINF